MNKLKLFYYCFFNKKKYHNYLILKWIKDAKECYLKEDWCVGMCYAFIKTIPKYFKKKFCNNCYSERIKNFIPEYYPEFFGTKEIEYDDELDNAIEEGYWWKHYDEESRIKAFDKLIEIYKNKCVQ